MFFVVYWPPQVSRSGLGLPPPALGSRVGPELCRWLLATRYSAADAPPDVSGRSPRRLWRWPARATESSSTHTGSRWNRAEDLLPADPYSYRERAGGARRSLRNEIP